MGTGGYIGIGFGALVVAYFVYEIISSNRQRKTPVEQRKMEIIEELKRRESSTGRTDIDVTYRSGISKEQLREFAEQAGYRFVGDTGGIGQPHMEFQRRLDGESSSEADPDQLIVKSDADPLAQFEALLTRGEQSTSTRISIDMTVVNREDGRRCHDYAAANGWQIDDFETRQDRTYWVLVPSAKKSTAGPAFCSGPRIAELRAISAARAAAAEVRTKSGVNPLSSTTISENNAYYKRENRKLRRWVTLFALSMVLFIFLFIGIRDVISGSTGGTVVLVLMILSLIAMMTGLIRLISVNRAMKATLRPYRNAYEQVVAAAFGKE